MGNQSLLSSKETPYFVISIVFSVIIYLLAIISVVGILIAAAILAILLVMNAIMIGSIRGNGIRVNEKQFPDVYKRVVDLSVQMGVAKVPDIFVINSEGALNAFATRFMGRNMMVIYSEVFELARQQGEKELDFIIAHELAHIKRRHVWKNILTMPANFIPFLSQAYSRACEYTCDRHAAYYTQDGIAAKRALIILGVGKGLYKEVDEVSYLEQIESESNVAVWFSEVLSSHPNLPKRIQTVGQFMQVEGTPNFRSNAGRITVGALIAGGAITVLYVGIIFFFALGSTFLSTFLVGFQDEYDSPSLNGLMEAAADGDVKEVEKYVVQGQDIFEEDDEHTTALHYAVYNSNVEVAEVLLENGANPNDSDNYSTVLTAALSNGDYELAALLYEYGADPLAKDVDGESGVSYLGVQTEEEFKEILEY
ncbi:M48 family metallopeptidase [Sporosarcina sp.]|uniref:M48 family metallopeptidase n=1 Tax=Sporosarcina sp. TaxID=49982 RepID=UPI0026299493|nr:M48 family metallopeptidase [Sporosarcina sp.]